MSSDNSISRSGEQYESKITAHVIDEKKGGRVFENLQAIRINSGDYRLLIMADYAPILGKIDGDVTFISERGEEVFENVKAFYKHQHNVFTLIIDESKEAEKE